MKTHPTPKRPAGGRKMPKARIMYAHPAEFDNPDSGILTLALSRKQVPHETVPVLVIQPSLASAKRKLPWLRMSAEEKVERIKHEFRAQFVCFTMPENEAILERGVRAILTLTGDLP